MKKKITFKMIRIMKTMMIKLQFFKIQIKKRKIVDIFNNSKIFIIINDEKITIFAKKQKKFKFRKIQQKNKISLLSTRKK